MYMNNEGRSGNLLEIMFEMKILKHFSATRKTETVGGQYITLIFRVNLIYSIPVNICRKFTWFHCLL